MYCPSIVDIRLTSYTFSSANHVGSSATLRVGASLIILYLRYLSAEQRKKFCSSESSRINNIPKRTQLSNKN